jgi:hypothetical protein
MHKWISCLFLVVLALSPGLSPVAAGGGCPMERHLVKGDYGDVTFSNGQPVNVRETPSKNGKKRSQMPEGTRFHIIDGPICADDINWWQIETEDGQHYGWIAEGLNGEYFVEPYQFVPPTSAPVMNVPMATPVPPVSGLPLPEVAFQANPDSLNTDFIQWDWAAFSDGDFYKAPDPLALRLPDAYQGDMPALPVDLSTARFVADARLSPEQLAALAQNGFVVVPMGKAQFDEVYRYPKDWDVSQGYAFFITTDALLHSLHLGFDNLLKYAEKEAFAAQIYGALQQAQAAALAQLAQAKGTPLEGAAFNAAVYYTVALRLSENSIMRGENMERMPVAYRGQQGDPAVDQAAQVILDQINAAAGRATLSILDPDVEEDFSQYKPRGHYTGDSLLEGYFRTMMWLGRITFRAKSDTETQTALLALRALQSSGDAFKDWQSVYDTLGFLVGPTDDFGPAEYAPLAEKTFGEGLPLDALADTGKLSAFQSAVKELPGPRINSIPLPVGTTADQVDEFTRGFRLFGQRFTFDGYVMQELIYPKVGTRQNSRALPLGLDVPAAFGSDTAYALADQAGATAFANYTDQVKKLRGEVASLTAKDWMQNVYGGWLWTLQPLWVQNPALLPPLMKTDAWKRKDLQTSLGSWTELKHDTLLYAKEPEGGLGGGGVEPPITSYSVVEPNPLVFSRISIVAMAAYQGMKARGFDKLNTPGYTSGLLPTLSNLKSISFLSAYLAEMARKEVAGETLTHDELYFLQESFGNSLWYIRYMYELPQSEPPKSSAIVADVASNSAAGTVLEVGTGGVDYLYVVTGSPNGLQVTRGAVFSYYEFEQPIDSRLTDEEWRAKVEGGQLPPRPAWTSAFVK